MQEASLNAASVRRPPALPVNAALGFMTTSRQQLLFGLGVSVALLTGIATLIMFFLLNASSRRVAHTLEVQSASQALMSVLKDMETGQRGYLLTGSEAYLEPYLRGADRIRPDFEKLRDLTVDNPEQQEFLRQLEPVIEARVGHLREGISLMKSGLANRAFDRVKEGGGKELMDKIRQLITQFCETEERLLRQRQSNEAVSRNVLLGLIIGGLAALSAIAVSVVGSQRRLIAQLQDEARKREAAEATLRQAQKTEAVGQLTGGIAHDFNNLLTVILGNLDTIRRRLANADPSVTAPLVRPLDAALQGARGAAKLTHRLLAFSRQQPLEPKPLDLNKLLRGMSDMLERMVGAPSEMEMVLMGGLWPTFADANQLENALINLVVNARDAMPGGGKITIETANGYLDEAYAARFVDVKPGQYVVLSVTDTGCGIAPDILERVFDPFFTTKEPGTGTGLGLSMVHGFVKQSGGHIRIYSEVGQGTTVKIYLPKFIQAASVAAMPASSEPPLTLPMRAKGAETVLVVEDSDAVLEFVISALEDLGYRVLSARSGPEALRALESEEKIDLLFTDVVLPGDITGRELADRALRTRPGLPILYTTGFSRNAIVHQGRLDTGVSFLGKPYTQSEVAQWVRALLDKAQNSSHVADV
jgi:signal transduction histidine kinase/ActR/RegA family two-component response regulator